MITKQNVEICFEQAKKYGARYIGVIVETEGHEGPEIIINPLENFDKKLEYYKNAYTDNMVLKTYSGIRITAIQYANTFEQLECSLMNSECVSI